MGGGRLEPALLPTVVFAPLSLLALLLWGLNQPLKNYGKVTYPTCHQPRPKTKEAATREQALASPRPSN